MRTPTLSLLLGESNTWMSLRLHLVHLSSVCPTCVLTPHLNRMVGGSCKRQRTGDKVVDTMLRHLTGVSLTLGFGPTVSAVSLSVRPNLQQIYSKNSVYLSCEEGGRIERRTAERQKENVRSLFGRPTGQCGNHLFGSCFTSSPSDSGQYWCETSDGQRSEQVNITVFPPDRPLLLEIPALPVVTGSEVTFRCRTKDGATPAAYFFRNGVHVRDKVAAERLTLGNIQQSDEGFYSCSTDKLGSSPQSWLRVKGPSPTLLPPSFPSTLPTFTMTTPTFYFTSSTFPSAPPPSLLLVPAFIGLLCHLVVVSLLCISTVLMWLRCCSRKTGKKLAVEECDDITGDITTEHNF